MTKRFPIIGLYLAALVALLDQGSKWYVLGTIMRPARTFVLTPYLNFVLVWNKGVTFGLLGHFGEWMPYVFAGVAALIMLFLVFWLYRTTSMMGALGLGLVMGGAFGNIVDRLRFGAVMDFIDFHLETHHWYAFNLADAAIVCGVGLLLLENLVTTSKRR